METTIYTSKIGGGPEIELIAEKIGRKHTFGHDTTACLLCGRELDLYELITIPCDGPERAR